MRVHNGILSGLFQSSIIGRELFLVFGLLLSFPATSLAQHPSCYYYPPGSCPSPPALPQPTVNEVPSYDGSFVVSVVNNDPYSWTEWSTGQTGSSISISGKSTGTYGYSAQRCIDTGTSDRCSSSSSVTVYVLRTPGIPAFGSISPSACTASLTVNWMKGSGYPSGSTTYYDLQESINGGAWTDRLVDSTSIVWSRSAIDGANYQYRVRSRYKWNGYYSNKTAWVNSTALAMPECEDTSIVPQPVEQVSDVIGSTGGSVTVLPSGAAGYSIPLQVPPGIGGMAPKISLDYNSQGGYGFVGTGWSLGGFSAITRCAATLEPDGIVDGVDFDNDDRFCLDGKKLILVPGTGSYGDANSEYRTEIDSFSKIIAVGSAGGEPASFIVHARTGEEMLYGSRTDSRIEAEGRSDVMTWALTTITDSTGNKMEFYYNEYASNTEYVPNRVEYAFSGGISGAKVQFTYTTQDSLTMYVAASVARNTRLLQTITTYSAGLPVKEYQLDYQTGPGTLRKRLESLTECSRVSGTVCLEPTVFAWNGSEGSFDIDTFGNLRSTDNVGFAGTAQWAIDVDGDGKQELVYNRAGTTEYYYVKKTGSSTWSTHLWFNRDYGVAEGFHHWPMDVNGDGLTDLVYKRDDSSFGRYVAVMNTGSGGTLELPWATGTAWDPFPEPAYNGMGWPLDVNGDGAMDLVYSSNYSYYALISDPMTGVATLDYLGEREQHGVGQGGTHWVMDVNSDGRADLVYSQAGTLDYWAVINKGTSTWTPEFLVTRQYPAAFDSRHWVMDANADGLTDILYGHYGTNDYRVLINKGDGTMTEQLFGTRQETPGWNGSAWFIDVNADGVKDLVYNKHTTDNYYALVSQPDGSRKRELFGSKSFAVGFDGMHIEIDTDGDGLTELLLNVKDTKQYKTMGIQSSFDLLKSVTDSFGNLTSIQYKALNDASVYDKVWNPYNSYPHVISMAPMRVVSKVTVPDGVGGTRSTQYSYKTLRINRRGRGSEGFEEVISTDTKSDIRVETEHHQIFPRTGLVLQSIRCLDTGGTCADNKILQRTYIAYATQTTVNGPGLADARQVYPSSTVETMYALDNGTDTTSVLATITTTNANPDDYGNIRSITVENESAVNAQFYKTTTTNVYANDTADWHLGLLTSSVVTKYLDGGTATDTNSVRKTAFEYDPVTHLLTREIVEPDRAEPLKRVTVYQRDGYGNITKATTCATDFESCEPGAAGPANLPFRTVTKVYDSLGQFPQSVTNAEGESESYVYERKFGNKLSLTGPNNLTTAWLYDNFGKLLKETRPDGTYTWTTYKLCDQDCPEFGFYYVLSESTGGASSTEYFDAQGRKLRTRTLGFRGQNIHVDTVYNDLGQTAQISEPYFEGDTIYWTQSEYDLIGRVVTLTPPLSPAVSTDYDGLTVTMSRIANGVLRTESETKNIIGQTASVTNPAGTKLLYTYDSQGNLTTTQTQGYSNTLITVTYDLFGRKTQVIDPDMGAWSYQYNGYGDLVSQTDARSQTVTMKYDNLGRLIERHEAEGLSEWSYGDSSTYTTTNRNIGKLIGVSGPDELSIKTIAYDSLGRPIQTTTVIDLPPYDTVPNYLTGQTYDGVGRISLVQYPLVNGSRFQVKNHYNLRGYLKKVTSPDGSTVYWEAEDLNARGQLEVAQLGNGASVVNTYQPETGWLDGIMVDATNLIYHMSYDIDEVGNIESRTDHRQNLTESFQYDILDQITNSSVTGGTGHTPKSYSYDALGNILSKTGVGAYTYGTCGAGPHAVCQAGGATYVYNANGSITSGGGRTVEYTSFNLPYQFIQGGTVTFHYDADRIRVFKSSSVGYTAYIGMTDTGNPLYEHEVQGSTDKHLHFIYAGGQALAVHTIQTGGSPQTNTQYLHRDHLGSVEAISDSSGAAEAYFSHDAWGKPRNADWTDATGTPAAPGNLGFTGHEMIPEAGLVHMNGRVYDPLLGKFLSADPRVQFEKDVRSYNRYSYVSNNPLRYTDPTGYDMTRFGQWLRKNIVTIVNVVSWFYPPLQPFAMALNVVAIAYYASDTGQAAMGIMAMFVGGALGAGVAEGLGSGASEFMQAVVRGGTSGAVSGGANAMMMGGNLGRGILQGMASGAVTSAIAWKVTQSPADGVVSHGSDPRSGNRFEGAYEKMLEGKQGDFNSETMEIQVKGVKIIVGGWKKNGSLTVDDATSIGKEVVKIFNTKRGAAYLQELKNGGDPLMIFLNDAGINAGLTYDTGSGPPVGHRVLTVDPNSKSFFRDSVTNKVLPMSFTRALSHEMGHAIMGTLDAGSSNTILNEDPIMLEIDNAQRGKYRNFCVSKQDC